MNTIDTELIGNIGIIYFNRPEKLNSFSFAMGQEYSQQLAAMDNNNDIAVIIITGRGRAFSVGADLSEGANSFDKLDAFSSSPVLPAYKVKKPVIAAMQGHALGLGFGIALQCDFRIVANEAKYGLIQAGLGLVADCNSHWLLPKLIGFERAGLFLMQAEKHSGQAIADLGLATISCASAKVLPQAITLAQALAVNAPASLSFTKQLLWRQLDNNEAQSQQLETSTLLQRLNMKDARIAAQAFVDKTKPDWQDKVVKLED